jgi:phage terminase large subunit
MSADNPFVAMIERYGSSENGPMLFVREILGAVPEAYQEDLLRAVGRGERKISVRSGHGTGKSTTLSWAMIWFVLFRFPCKVVVTAPTTAQLYDALFAEMKRWLNELPEALQVLLEVKTDRVELTAAPSEAFISARTSRAEQPEALAGVHSDHVLLVVDEASGVPEQVFEAASGSMSGHSAITILAGNPTRTSGTFYETHTRLAGHWYTLHWSCIDSPRVSDAFVDEMKLRYGEDSNAYRIRVLGEFAQGDDDTIIPLHLAEAAKTRDVRLSANTRPIWGLDVARFGSDRTALCKRYGAVVTEVETWKGLDLMQTVGRVKAQFDGMLPSERPSEILVDVIGLGSGVYDRLRELGLPVRSINVSEAPAFGNTYNNLRTELIFRFRGWLEQRGSRLPDDPELIAELTSIRYSFASTGKMKAEGKDDMRRRGLKSPDKADAVFLTFAGDAATSLGSPTSNWSKPIKRGLKGIA